jgi:SAM-dependent methyltransferase
LVFFPWLIGVILGLRPASVLDYGEGDGKFLAELRQQFAGELWRYDPSLALEARARRLLQSANVRFCCDAKSLESESIDAVSSIAVWMTLSSHQACLQYLAEQHRLLRRDGRAFIVVTYPCFREESTRPSRPNSRTRATCRMVSLSRSRSSTVTRLSSSLTTTGTYQPCLSISREVGFRLLALTELPDAPGGNPRGAPWLCFEFDKA